MALCALTLLTDRADPQIARLKWRDLSAWLLFAGLAVGGLAVLLWLIGLAVYRRRPMWLVVFLTAVVMAQAFVNRLVQASDGWTSFMPRGPWAVPADLPADACVGDAAPRGVPAPSAHLRGDATMPSSPFPCVRA